MIPPPVHVSKSDRAIHAAQAAREAQRLAEVRTGDAEGAQLRSAQEVQARQLAWEDRETALEAQVRATVSMRGVCGVGTSPQPRGQVDGLGG